MLNIYFHKKLRNPVLSWGSLIVLLLLYFGCFHWISVTKYQTKPPRELVKGSKCISLVLQLFALDCSISCCRERAQGPHRNPYRGYKLRVSNRQGEDSEWSCLKIVQGTPAIVTPAGLFSDVQETRDPVTQTLDQQNRLGCDYFFGSSPDPYLERTDRHTVSVLKKSYNTKKKSEIRKK